MTLLLRASSSGCEHILKVGWRAFSRWRGNSRATGYAPSDDAAAASEKTTPHYRDRKAQRESRIGQRAKFEIPSSVHLVVPRMKIPATGTPSVRFDVEAEEFNSNNKHVSLQHLMDAGVHLGHATSRWNPRMAPYIFGIRQGIHIIDLNQTIAMLRRALYVTKEVARRNGIILFVCSSLKDEYLKDEIVKDVLRCEQYPLIYRWLPGLLTNVYQVLGSEACLPDLVIFLNTKEEHPQMAINETVRAGISTIAICDTDCDPSQISYVVPGNNDSAASIRLFSRLFSNAALEGRKIGLAQGLFEEQSRQE